MRVLQVDSQAFHHQPYLCAASGGGTESLSLPFQRGRVEGLPDGLDALVLTSDLQGVAPSWRDDGATALLGEVVVDVLEQLSDSGQIPPLWECGAVLAGDLYSTMDARKRGASGDVRSVWTRFAESFRWVAGAPGNHDRFGTAKERMRLSAQPNIHLLDGALMNVDGLRIAGVGGITAPEHKLHKGGRRLVAEQLSLVHEAAEASPDILVLHEGPAGIEPGQRGHTAITDVLRERTPPLVVCGHVHWTEALSPLADGHVVNVDARVVVLTRA
ncbi:MAG: metallophosphoesterase [Polyangiales bacterium]